MDTQTIINPASLEEAFELELKPVKTGNIIEKSYNTDTALVQNESNNHQVILPFAETITAPILVESKINQNVKIEFQPKPFIEANTQEVSLQLLKNDCVIPVFSKDNEKTIAHFEFINITQDCIAKVFPHHSLDKPEIRVSHQIKGRTPDALYKNVKDLLDHERTQYFERMAL